MPKLFISICILLSSSCAHLIEKQKRESIRHYVFSIDKLGGNWPEGFQVEGRYGLAGPKIEYLRIPEQIDGHSLIQEHGVWLLKGEGRWVKTQSKELK